jgi:hypothetical protein
MPGNQTDEEHTGDAPEFDADDANLADEQTQTEDQEEYEDFTLQDPFEMFEHSIPDRIDAIWTAILAEQPDLTVPDYSMR